MLAGGDAEAGERHYAAQLVVVDVGPAVEGGGKIGLAAFDGPAQVAHADRLAFGEFVEQRER
jgi:hypothetical protein